MATRTPTRALLTVLALTAAGYAQSSPPQAAPNPPCPAANQSQPSTQPCTPAAPAKKPSVSEQFPFPGSPSKPAAPDASTTPNSAATDHPFPTTPAPRLPGDDSSSSSSSSSSNSSDGSSSGSADPDTPAAPGPPGTEGTSTHRRLPKPKHVMSDDERVDEDLTVARFYMGDDNLQGAYLRAKDAVKIQPEYSSAHFTLAQVAQKLKKKDEAVAEFKAYLKLDPDGEKSTEARRALNELQ
jgi:hypothetical protein